MRTLFLIVASVAVFVLSQSVEAESRIALVIGNGAYSASPLSAPPNDAHLIADTLRRLGFGVTEKTNVTQKDMKRLIRDFGNRLKKNNTAIGVFYYSGHGMQVGGRNYMIPVGSDIMNESDVDIEGVGIDNVLARMNVAGNAMNFVILDACRDNPFEKRFKSGTKGLGRMDAPQGSLIAFAAQPNKVALQGAGKYSYFTEALAREIEKANLPAFEMLMNVRKAVRDETNGRQVPVVEDQRLAKFFFQKEIGTKPPRETRTAIEAQPRVKETVEKVVAHYTGGWRSLRNSKTKTWSPDYIDLRDLKAEFANGCTDNEKFMSVSRGLALIFSYYYLGGLHYSGRPISEFYYESGHVGAMLAGMGAEDIISEFGEYLNLVDFVDREDLAVTVDQFIEYYDLFTKHYSRKKEQYMSKKSWLKSEDFYMLGFPKTEEECFTKKPYLSGIKLPGRKESTSYVTMNMSYEAYFYSFWFRRHKEGNQEKMRRLFEFARFILN